MANAYKYGGPSKTQNTLGPNPGAALTFERWWERSIWSKGPGSESMKVTASAAWHYLKRLERAAKEATTEQPSPRAGELVSSDLAVDGIDPQDLSKHVAYRQGDEAPSNANAMGWYSAAVYWRYRAEHGAAATAERMPLEQSFKRGDEVWIRGKVMNAMNDELVVAPYSHRNGGGSIAVKFEDVRADRQPRAERTPPRWECPDCGYKDMPWPPKDYHICPKCMVEFGNDDKASQPPAERTPPHLPVQPQVEGERQKYTSQMNETELGFADRQPPAERVEGAGEVCVHCEKALAHNHAAFCADCMRRLLDGRCKYPCEHDTAKLDAGAKGKE